MSLDIGFGGSLDRLDPLRAYIIRLRKLAKLDQDEVASLVGIGYRTYMAWETGETKDIKLPVIRKIVQVLGGSFQHLEHIDDMSPEEAGLLAETWHGLNADEKDAARQGGETLARMIQLSEKDPVRLELLLRRLRDDSREDKQLLDLVEGFLTGYHAGSVRRRESEGK